MRDPLSDLLTRADSFPLRLDSSSPETPIPKIQPKKRFSFESAMVSKAKPKQDSQTQPKPLVSCHDPKEGIKLDFSSSSELLPLDSRFPRNASLRRAKDYAIHDGPGVQKFARKYTFPIESQYPAINREFLIKPTSSKLELAGLNSSYKLRKNSNENYPPKPDKFTPISISISKTKKPRFSHMDSLVSEKEIESIYDRGEPSSISPGSRSEFAPLRGKVPPVLSQASTAVSSELISFPENELAAPANRPSIPEHETIRHTLACLSPPRRISKAELLHQIEEETQAMIDLEVKAHSLSEKLSILESFGARDCSQLEQYMSDLLEIKQVLKSDSIERKPPAKPDPSESVSLSFFKSTHQQRNETSQLALRLP